MLLPCKHPLVRILKQDQSTASKKDQIKPAKYTRIDKHVKRRLTLIKKCCYIWSEGSFTCRIWYTEDMEGRFVVLGTGGVNSGWNQLPCTCCICFHPPNCTVISVLTKTPFFRPYVPCLRVAAAAAAAAVFCSAVVFWGCNASFADVSQTPAAASFERLLHKPVDTVRLFSACSYTTHATSP